MLFQRDEFHHAADHQTSCEGGRHGSSMLISKARTSTLRWRGWTRKYPSILEALLYISIHGLLSTSKTRAMILIHVHQGEEQAEPLTVMIIFVNHQAQRLPEEGSEIALTVGVLHYIDKVLKALWLRLLMSGNKSRFSHFHELK